MERMEMTTTPRRQTQAWVTGVLALLAGAGSDGWAQEASEVAPECAVPDRTEDDPSVTWVDWEGGETVDGTITVRATHRADLRFTIEGRVHFASQDVTWSQGPYDLAAGESASITVDLPEGAYFDAQQQVYLSDLAVRLVITNASTEEEIERVSAPRLKVVWTDAGATMLLLRREEAATVAPGDVYSTTEATAVGVPEDAGMTHTFGYNP